MLKRIGKYVSAPEESEVEDEEENVEFLTKKREKEQKSLKDFQKEYQEKAEESDKEETPVPILCCTVCDKKLFSEVDYNNHMNSKKHLKLWKETIKKEIEEEGFKKFLIKKQFLTPLRTNYNKLKYLLYLNSIQKIIKK